MKATDRVLAHNAGTTMDTNGLFCGAEYST